MRAYMQSCVCLESCLPGVYDLLLTISETWLQYQMRRINRVSSNICEQNDYINFIRFDIINVYPSVHINSRQATPGYINVINPRA